MTFHLTSVNIIFSSVSVAEWPPFGKQLITSVSYLCILFTLIIIRKRRHATSFIAK